MEIITPKYYNKFKCIANKCIHSCCIGWDIEIDACTFNTYKSAGGKFEKHIYADGDTHYFKADQNGRCPFLNKSGLCDIITELGKDALCQICADHPRFKNFYFDAEEIGLGMCCEEAARIILEQTDSFCVPTPKWCTDEEKSFFKLRSNIFAILQDREFSFYERLENLADLFNITIPKKSADEWKAFFKTLEILDPTWTDTLELMTDGNIGCEWDGVFEQLACYFVFRHLPGALDDGQYIERIGFCIIACRVIKMICAGFCDLTFEKIADVCRAFSAEIEYSSENPQTIFDIVK